MTAVSRDASPSHSPRPQADARDRARAILAEQSAFQGCSPAFLDDLMAHGVVVRLGAGETLFCRGEPGDSMMVVLSGALQVTNTTSAGDDVILAALEAGSVIGEIAVLDGQERTATVIAIEPVEAVAVYRHDLFAILETHPDALVALVETMCQRLRATNALVESYSLEAKRMFRNPAANKIA